MTKTLSYVKHYKKQLILGPVAKLIEAIFELMTPLLFMRMIDIGIKNNDTNYILLMGFIIFITTIGGFFCALYCQWSASVASTGYGTVLRNELFEKINRLAYDDYLLFGNSTLTTRMTSDINNIQVGLNMFIRLVVRAPFLAIGGLIMAFSINKSLSIVNFLFVPIFFIFVLFFIRKSIPLYNNVQKNLDNLASKISEYFFGIKVIRAFSADKNYENQFDDINEKLYKANIKAGSFSIILSPLTSLFINIIIAIIIYFGSSKVYTGDLSQGELVAFISYLSQILLALIVVSNLTIIFNKAYVSLYRVEEIFKCKDEYINEKQLINFNLDKMEKKIDTIELNNVSFKYPKSFDYSISNINLKLTRGDKIAIVGATGSGKTTLANLLTTLIRPTDGEIYINELNIKDMDIKSIKKYISYVPQKTLLFSDSLINNITLGVENVNAQQVDSAILISNLSTLVNNSEEKLNLKINESGRNLSGGQKQRLSIARALTRDFSLIVLDNALSAIDNKTASNISNSIYNLKDIIVINISENINQIENYDKIIILEHGKITGTGTHERLLSTNNYYKQLFELQTKLKQL